MSADAIKFIPLSTADAQTITGWRYPEEYSSYNIAAGNAESSVRYMTDLSNAFFAAYRQQELIGFCSIGNDGRVQGGIYDDSAIDIGAGMRPDLTGKKEGTGFLRAVVTFIQARHGRAALRATIASWNERALRTAFAVGFREHSTFATPDSGTFVVLVRLP